MGGDPLTVVGRERVQEAIADFHGAAIRRKETK
jgi:hypothetical protein